MKKAKFYTTENVQRYVNFISDNNLADKLDSYWQGYESGNFYIDIEGPDDIVDQIKNLYVNKVGRGKYIRTSEHKLKQSKIKTK